MGTADPISRGWGNRWPLDIGAQGWEEPWSRSHFHATRFRQGSPHHLDPGAQGSWWRSPRGEEWSLKREEQQALSLGGRREEAGPELALAKKDKVGKNRKVILVH